MALPLILFGLGSLASGLGMLALGKDESAGTSRPSTLAPSPVRGDLISSVGQHVNFARNVRWADLVIKTLAAVSGIGQTAPPDWLILGHLAKEANGNPNESTDRVCCKKVNGKCTQYCRERGLMQLMPEQSRALGLDHERMYEPAYSIAAGVKMYQQYHDALARALHFASDSDLWRAAYYLFAVGSGTFDKVTKGILQPTTWAALEAHVRAYCGAHKCLSSTTRFLDNNQSAWEFGNALASRALPSASQAVGEPLSPRISHYVTRAGRDLARASRLLPDVAPAVIQSLRESGIDIETLSARLRHAVTVGDEDEVLRVWSGAQSLADYLQQRVASQQVAVLQGVQRVRRRTVSQRGRMPQRVWA